MRCLQLVVCPSASTIKSCNSLYMMAAIMCVSCIRHVCMGFHCHFIHFFLLSSFFFFFLCLTEIDGIDPDEKVFLERLNNTSRFYETIPRAVRTAATPRPDPNSSSELVNNVKNRAPRTVSFPLKIYLYIVSLFPRTSCCCSSRLVGKSNLRKI